MSFNKKKKKQKSNRYHFTTKIFEMFVTKKKMNITLKSIIILVAIGVGFQL